MRKIITSIVIISMMGLLGACGKTETVNETSASVGDTSASVGDLETATTQVEEPEEELVLVDALDITSEENAKFYIMRVNDDYNEIMNHNNWIYLGNKGEYPPIEDGQIAYVTADISIYGGGESGYDGNYFIENLKDYEIVSYDDVQKIFNFPDAEGGEYTYDIRILSYFHDDHKYFIVLNADYIKVYDDGVSVKEYYYDDYDSDLDGFWELFEAN